MSLKDLLIKAKLIEEEESGEEETSEMPPSRMVIPEPVSAPEVLINLDAPSDPATSPRLNTPSVTDCVVSALSFEQIYSQANIPPVSFPAERMLKVLEGLAGMDQSNRRAAIAAMDAADETWSIEGVIQDASQKAQALTQHLERMATTVSVAQEQDASQKAALIAQHGALCASIAEQIAQLQEAAQLAATDHACALAALEAKTASTMDASQQEQSRIQTEITRLISISAQVGSATN